MKNFLSLIGSLVILLAVSLAVFSQNVQIPADQNDVCAVKQSVSETPQTTEFVSLQPMFKAQFTNYYAFNDHADANAGTFIISSFGLMEYKKAESPLIQVRSEQGLNYISKTGPSKPVNLIFQDDFKPKPNIVSLE